MKEFVTAANEAAKDPDDVDEGFEFKVDGVPCRAYRPKDGQLAVLMATNTRHTSLEEKIAGLINFFVAVLDSQSHSYIVSRLLDREDEFGIEQVEEIMEWMVEEWTGRPTKQPSGSTQSRKSGGRKSTQRTPALTS